MKSLWHWNNDSGFWRFWSLMGDLVAVNLLFLFTSLPVITLGAARTALYSVMFRLHRKEETDVVKEYFGAFRSAFKRSTLLWLPLLFFGVVSAFFVRLFMIRSEMRFKYFLILYAALIFFALIIFLYVFPLQSVYEGGWPGLIAAALRIGAVRFPWTLAVLGVTAAAAGISLYNSVTIVLSAGAWLLFGFGLLAYFNSFFFLKAFRPWLTNTESEKPKS